MIVVSNKGPELLESNYWTSNLAAQGNAFLSWNAGAARLLLPPAYSSHLRVMSSAQHVVLSRGSMHGFGVDALELLFEDGSDEPFCIHMPREHGDRIVPKSDAGPTVLSAWTQAGKAFVLPAWYRVVGTLPDLSQLRSEESILLSTCQLQNVGSGS